MSADRIAGSLTAVAYITVMTLGMLAAQADLPATQMVSVDGRMMQVRAAGLDSRKPGAPILILEAGAGATLDSWDQVFADLARLAPVVAYDRRSHGRSEADTVPQTIKRDIENLRALLQSLSLGPPYVLIGHSWGGILIRGFAHTYPSDVAGLVYLDAPDIESTREEKAAVLPSEDRKRALEPRTFPPFPPDPSPGLRSS